MKQDKEIEYNRVGPAVSDGGPGRTFSGVNI